MCHGPSTKSDCGIALKVSFVYSHSLARLFPMTIINSGFNNNQCHFLKTTESINNIKSILIRHWSYMKHSFNKFYDWAAYPFGFIQHLHSEQVAIQFLSTAGLHFFSYIDCYTKAKELSLPYFLLFTDILIGDNWWIHDFPLSESSRIWAHFGKSISFKNDRGGKMI